MSTFTERKNQNSRSYEEIRNSCDKFVKNTICAKLEKNDEICYHIE